MDKKKLLLMVRGGLITFDELVTSLGLRKAIKVFNRLGQMMRQGGAFGHLPPHPDPKINGSREQMALAVNLYQALLEAVDEDQAYDITRKILVLSSVMYLRAVYPSFAGKDFTKVIAAGDAAVASERLGLEFPFADTETVDLTQKTCGFDVKRCRVPEVLAEVGAEKLAPIFCEVDYIYFPIYAPEVELTRTQTLIHGGSTCDFRFVMKE